jgi:hypothetical protein
VTRIIQEPIEIGLHVPLLSRELLLTFEIEISQRSQLAPRVGTGGDVQVREEV